MSKIRTCLYCIPLLYSFTLHAQTDRSALNGTVTDPTGAVVPQVAVQAKSTSTAWVRQTVTSGAGNYEMPALLVGTYQLTFTKDGFKPFVMEGIELTVGQARTVDARLQVGSQTDVVNVSASTELLNQTSAEVGGVIEATQINEIPLSGRNWATLMTLAPGAINYGGGSQRDIRFNGHSLDDNNFTFDGIDTTGIQEQTQKAEPRLTISLDSIQEFRVSSAVYTAESGAAAGVQVNVVSKSGSNNFHGETFEYLRNQIFDTRSPFDDSHIPPFRLNQFGTEFGGPIIKNKLFFFANYEGLRQTLGQTFINTVPDVAFRAQVLAASPALAPILNAYPVGISNGDGVSAQLRRQKSNTTREDSGMMRMDYHFSDTSTAYLRYSIDNALVDNPQDAIGARNVIPAVPQNVVLAWQKIFSPTLINEAKFGLNRSDYHNWTYGTSPISASFASFDGVLDNTLDTEVGTSFSYIDNLTKIMGRHTFKAGIDIRRIRLNNSGNTIQDQTIDFATDSDFINNHSDQVTYLAAEGVRGGRRTFYMGYAQDEFKVMPNLTLNLGLRYEFYSVYHEVLGRSQTVDILGCGGFCPKGAPFYDPNPFNFGPRVGVAWSQKIFGGKTTVFRSGFGIYYGANQNDDFSDPMESSVPRYAIANTDAPNLSYPIDPFLTPQYSFYQPKAINRHRKDGYYENWDFNIQQELPFNFMGQVGYVGSEGHHLFSRERVNLINPATGLRTLPQFAEFGMKSNYGNNNFNALQLSLQRRFTNGWLWQTQYMWSHAIADSSGGAGESFDYQNQACRACDRSNSGFDVRHTMITNSVYELPVGKGRKYLNNRGLASQVFGGWELSGVFTVRTGLPVDITMKPQTTPLDGNLSGQRPDLVPGQSIYAAHRTIDNWFNPDAFAFPAPGKYGDLGRNIARGPGYYEIDTALQKEFAVTERIKLKFRAEAFNLFNHPAYDVPASSWTETGKFGQITGILNGGAVGTGTPRRMQFVLRIEY
jgi:hypothetical protein